MGELTTAAGFAAHAANAARIASRPLSLLGLLLLAACQSVPSAQPAAAAPPPGQAFAEASCSGCHATGLYGTSPNPNAPPFGAIANHEGVTEQTLSYWLRSAHDYPMEMNFLLNDREADALVAYFLSLRRADYRRPSD